MVILKITVFYPEPKLYKIGEKGVKNISINDNHQKINIANEDGTQMKIVGLPYEAIYGRAESNNKRIKEYVID